MISSPESLIKKTALIWLPHQSFYAGMRKKRSLTRLANVVVTQQRCNLPMTISLGTGSKKRGMDVTISLHKKNHWYPDHPSTWPGMVHPIWGVIRSPGDGPPTKIENNSNLADELHLLGWYVFLDGFVVGSLGSWFRVNDWICRVSNISDRYAATMALIMVCPRLSDGRGITILNILQDSVSARINSRVLTRRQCHSTNIGESTTNIGEFH